MWRDETGDNSDPVDRAIELSLVSSFFHHLTSIELWSHRNAAVIYRKVRRAHRALNAHDLPDVAPPPLTLDSPYPAQSYLPPSPPTSPPKQPRAVHEREGRRDPHEHARPTGAELTDAGCTQPPPSSLIQF